MSSEQGNVVKSPESVKKELQFDSASTEIPIEETTEAIVVDAAPLDTAADSEQEKQNLEKVEENKEEEVAVEKEIIEEKTLVEEPEPSKDVPDVEPETEVEQMDVDSSSKPEALIEEVVAPLTDTEEKPEESQDTDEVPESQDTEEKEEGTETESQKTPTEKSASPEAMDTNDTETDENLLSDERLNGDRYVLTIFVKENS